MSFNVNDKNSVDSSRTPREQTRKREGDGSERKYRWNNRNDDDGEDWNDPKRQKEEEDDDDERKEDNEKEATLEKKMRETSLEEKIMTENVRDRKPTDKEREQQLQMQMHMQSQIQLWQGERRYATRFANRQMVEDAQRAEQERQAAAMWHWTRSQYAKLDALLLSYGLERVPIAADGNCLFHSFASFFDDPAIDHRAIRQRVCDYIDQHRELFKIDIECDFPSVDHYLKEMRRLRVWGDGACLQAFCLAYSCNVFLFTPEGCSEMNPSEKRKKMAITNFQKHYTSTRVVKGPIIRMKQ